MSEKMARYYVDWSDVRNPVIVKWDGNPDVSPGALWQAKDEIIRHFDGIRDHAKEQIARAREIRATDFAPEPSPEPASDPAVTYRITVAKRNGVEEIHRPGCPDLKKRKGWGSDRDDWTLEVATLADLYREYWDCIADEAVDDEVYPTLERVWWAWRGEFKLFPCAGPVPEMPEPK